MSSTLRALVAVLFLTLPAASVLAAAPSSRAGTQSPAGSVQQVGVGDQVRIEVFGNPDLSTTVNVGDDGTVRMPLAGNVPVGGQTLPGAARRIEEALRQGQYLVDPQVTVTVLQSLSQRVSVVGEVGTPGRYAIESDTTVLDLIALAGGVTEKGSEKVYILRRDAAGTLQRINVNLRDMTSVGPAGDASLQLLQAGDAVIVPKGTFFITGQVVQPGEYRIEGDMLLFEAIARAGGVTPMGSTSRVEIRRRMPNDQVVEVKINKSTRIEPGDVIKVKERLF